MTDHILSSLALAQVSATGLIISFILFFSEKELNSDLLREKTTVFLENDLLVSLDLITVKDAEGEVVPLAVSILPKEECIDQFGRVYTLKSKDNVMRMWVGLNVKYSGWR